MSIHSTLCQQWFFFFFSGCVSKQTLRIESFFAVFSCDYQIKFVAEFLLGFSFFSFFVLIEMDFLVTMKTLICLYAIIFFLYFFLHLVGNLIYVNNPKTAVCLCMYDESSLMIITINIRLALLIFYVVYWNTNDSWLGEGCIKQTFSDIKWKK